MADRVTVVSRQKGLPPGLREPVARPTSGQKAARPQVPVGWVRFEPEDQPELAVLVELGTRKPWATGGLGGHIAVEKPGDKALSRFAGYSGLVIPIDIVIDGDGRSVQEIVDTVDALAGRGRKRTAGTAPNFVVDGAGLVPYDVSVYPDVRWVVQQDGLQWSDDEELNATNSDGHVTLAAATITILESNEGARLPDRQLASAMAAARRRSSSSKRYTVQAGDTLISIARRRLGDPGRWTEIKDKNGQPIRDPYAVKPGAIVRLP